MRRFIVLFFFNPPRSKGEIDSNPALQQSFLEEIYLDVYDISIDIL